MKNLLIQSLSISPADAGFVRRAKYRFAYYWRVINSLCRRLMHSNAPEIDNVSNEEDLKKFLTVASDGHLKPSAVNPKIILLGPYHFKQPMWSVRASSAMPDLITPIQKIAEVHLVTPIPNFSDVELFSKLIKDHGVYHHFLPPSYNLMTFGNKAELLDKLVARIQPDIIMNSFGVVASGFDAVSCARRNKIKSVLRVPGNELSAREKMKTAQKVASKITASHENLDAMKASFAVSHANHIMVMSEDEGLRVSNESKSKKDIFVQVRGVDTDIFAPDKDKIISSKKPMHVGFVGRLTLEKGTDILLEVIKNFSGNSNIKFHVASPEKLEDHYSERNENLVSHGYVTHNNMPSLMKKLDVLLLPSHMEGRSQTMMEAMSSGLPVLLQAKVHPECLPGMIHCNEEAKSFIDALEELSADMSKRTDLSKNARSSALKYFDKKNWAEKMSIKFKTILEAK